MPIIAGFFVPHPPILVPEVGRGEERKLLDTLHAYQNIATQIDALNPDTIILSSPHVPAYRDQFLVSKASLLSGSLAQFGAPNVRIQVETDTEMVQTIVSLMTEKDMLNRIQKTDNNLLDHGTMVPLYFIHNEHSKWKIVVLSTTTLSMENHYQMGQMIAQAVSSKKRIVWVSSGDLSHTLKADGPYGLSKEGPEFDTTFITSVETGQFQPLFELSSSFVNQAAVCGLGSFGMMLGALDGYQLNRTLLSYEGPFGVGYAVVSLLPQTLQIKTESDHVTLAKEALAYYIKTHRILRIPTSLPDDMIYHKHGVFVSIHKHGRLRGCIGTIAPTTSCVAEEIIHNAIHAGTRDYRFTPITEKELDDLEISVDVLYPPETIDSIDQLDVVRYGVIIRNGHKSGLLLPNLEGITSVEEQVDIARRKAGIQPNEPYQLQRFEVVRYH